MRRLLLPLALLAAFAAACGGDDDGGGGQGASSDACPSGAVEIKMADIKFDPQDATASVGQEACWVNEDSVDHNTVANSGASFESELFGKGKTFTTKLEEPGTVQYECTIHPGMTGTIEVTR
jgi:plastocyanin